MTNFKNAGATAIAALLTGTAAFAQVTPEEVWQNWQDMSSGYGQTMSAASAERDGDTLVVTDLSVVQDQDGVLVDVAIDEVNFTDNGDGTVDITMSDSYLIDLTLPPSDAAAGDMPTNVTVSVAQPGMVTTAGGTTTDTSYTVEAPSITISLDEIAGVDAAAVDAEASMTMTMVAGEYLVAGPSDAKTIDVDFGAQSVAFNVMAKDAESQSDVQMTGTLADLAASYAMDMGGMALMGTEMVAALKAGTALSGAFSHGAVDFTLDVTEATGPTRVVYASTGGGLTFQMDEAGLVYGVDSTGTAISVSGPEIPFPEFNVNYGEFAVTLAMPLLAAAEPSDFTFLTRIVDFSVSEDLWGMVDPANALPHSPATVVFDTKGKVRLTSDLVDEAAMAALGDAPPGEIHALEVTELRATVAGAELTGAGAFTFDNTDLVTFAGAPAPTGKIDLKLVGGNTLIDSLVAMGLLTTDDANGARMMMSMFANPGAGPDEMTSTLEFKDKGFFANGQQLQ